MDLSAARGIGNRTHRIPLEALALPAGQVRVDDAQGRVEDAEAAAHRALVAEDTKGAASNRGDLKAPHVRQEVAAAPDGQEEAHHLPPDKPNVPSGGARLLVLVEGRLHHVDPLAGPAADRARPGNPCRVPEHRRGVQGDLQGATSYLRKEMGVSGREEPRKLTISCQPQITSSGDSEGAEATPDVWSHSEMSRSVGGLRPLRGGARFRSKWIRPSDRCDKLKTGAEAGDRLT